MDKAKMKSALLSAALSATLTILSLLIVWGVIQLYGVLRSRADAVAATPPRNVPTAVVAECARIAGRGPFPEYCRSEGAIYYVEDGWKLFVIQCEERRGTLGNNQGVLVCVEPTKAP